MRVRYSALIAGPVLIAMTSTSGEGKGALSVRVAPRFCQEPCSVITVVDLEPRETDRELIIEADSGGFYRSSLIELDGIHEPSVHRLTWKSLPAGAYEVRVTLKRTTGEVDQVVTDVKVVGPEMARYRRD